MNVTIIMPVLNEAAGLGDLVRQLHSVLDDHPAVEDHEVLVVDDGSDDGSGQLAAEAGARVLTHPYRKGNGAAIKTGLRAASGDVVVLMDADGQHRPDQLATLLDALPGYEMVVGVRSRKAHAGWHRRLANALYNRLASWVTGFRIPDLTSGFRAVRRDIARRFVYLLPNTFSYPTTLTMALLRAGYSVRHVPVTVEPRRRSGSASKIRLLRDGSRFVVIILRIATLFSPLRLFLPLAALLVLLGLGWGGYTLVALHRFTNMALLLLVSGVLVLVLGLISEQIAQLRYDRSED